MWSKFDNLPVDKLSSTIAKDMSALMTSYSTDITSLSNTINTDINTYMANAAAIESVLGHGVALRNGVELNNDQSYFKKKEFDYNKIKLLFFGRIHYKKGINLILETK